MHKPPSRIRKASFVRIVSAAIFILTALPIYVYAQQGDATVSDSGSAAAKPVSPVEYYNADLGYQIGGLTVLAEPGVSDSFNIALGYGSLFSITTGSQNTATGYQTLFDNTTGCHNTATGYQTLFSNTTGCHNTADGHRALFTNATGSGNTASGGQALYHNNASYNTASGYRALFLNTSGTNNIAIGYMAAASVSGGNSNNIHIGSTGASDDNGVIRIGTSGTQTASYIVGVAGVTLPTPNEPLVCIDPPTGQLGTLNCATNGLFPSQQELVNQQQEIQTQGQQIADLQQRLSRLESLIAKN